MGYEITADGTSHVANHRQIHLLKKNLSADELKDFMLMNDEAAFDGREEMRRRLASFTYTIFLQDNKGNNGHTEVLEFNSGSSPEVVVQKLGEFGYTNVQLFKDGKKKPKGRWTENLPDSNKNLYAVYDSFSGKRVDAGEAERQNPDYSMIIGGTKQIVGSKVQTLGGVKGPITKISKAPDGSSQAHVKLYNAVEYDYKESELLPVKPDEV